MKRRIVALLLSLLICTSLLAGFTVSAAGYQPQYTAAAETLYDLGLFKGTGVNADGTPIFALEQKATRLQGLVMLLRLLGKEEAALAYTGANPFVDLPDWGKPYVGYAYANKLTNGTSATTFDPEGELLGKAYLTFVLRALGYDDAAGDFTYNDALTKAKEVALISGNACTGAIYRDDCAIVSLKALSTYMKGAKQTLAEKLVKDGVLSKDALKADLNKPSTTPTTPAEPENTGTISGTVTVPYQANTRKILIADIAAAIPGTYSVAGSSFGLRHGYGIPNTNPSYYALPDLFLMHSDIKSYCTGTGSSSLKIRAASLDSSYNVNLSESVSFVIVLDKNANMIAYCIIPPYHSANTVTFTTCFYNGKANLEATRELVRSFEKDVTKLDKQLFQYEQNGEKAYLRFDKEAVSKKIGEVAYFAVTSKDSNAINQFGSPWAQIEVNILREQGYEDFYPIDTGVDYRVFSWSDGVLFLYNKDKEIIGYADYSGGLNVAS